MKKILPGLICLLCSIHSLSQNYIPIDNGTEIGFLIKNLGLNVNGKFNKIKGKINFVPDNVLQASFNILVEAATVNTGNATRDNHLKKEDYFDVAKFPALSFVSTKITKSSTADNFLMEGKVTIKGVTKNVSFNFTADPKPGGYLFSGQFKLNRRDFGVGSKSLILADNLTVLLSVFAKKI